MIVAIAVISLILNIILLVALCFACTSSVSNKGLAEFNRLQWGKWEQEYWSVRYLPQNSNLKLSWIADGKVVKSENQSMEIKTK